MLCNTWALLWSNKTLFSKASGGPDLAWFMGPCPRTLASNLPCIHQPHSQMQGSYSSILFPPYIAGWQMYIRNSIYVKVIIKFNSQWATTGYMPSAWKPRVSSHFNLATLSWSECSHDPFDSGSKRRQTQEWTCSVSSQRQIAEGQS